MSRETDLNVTSQRRVVQGTCGWSDASLVECGRLYPKRSLTAAEKLSIYSRQGLFGCVEVDTSNYGIPKVESVLSWVRATPPGFVFHFKAYGLLVNGGMPFHALPKDIREDLGEEKPHDEFVTLEALGERRVGQLWDRFHQALQPAIDANKMGVVVFQFQLNVIPSAEARAHVEECARRLRGDVKMAIEFRSRLWIAPDCVDHMLDWLRGLRPPTGAAFICCDDLVSEVYLTKEAKAKDLKDLPLPWKDNHLPIILTARPCLDFAYVRLHRRIGTHRLLSDEEISTWSNRIEEFFRESSVRGPLYFLWGTDHEDQPLINAQHLAGALPRTLTPNWALHLEQADKQSIRTFFSRAAQSAPSNESHPSKSTCPQPLQCSSEKNVDNKKRAVSIATFFSPSSSNSPNKKKK
eukprot:scaffold1463_cov189-Ochromonas_danica.AAC.20